MGAREGSLMAGLTPPPGFKPREQPPLEPPPGFKPRLEPPPGFKPREAAAAPDTNALQDMKAGKGMQRAGQAYGHLRSAEGALHNTGEDQVGAVPEKMAGNLESMVPMKSIQRGKEAGPDIEPSISAPVRFPNVWRWDSKDPNEPGIMQLQQQEEAKGRKTAIINPGVLGGQITLVYGDDDPERGDVIATLRHNASFDPGKVRGASLLHRAAGPASAVQQAPVSAIRSVVTGRNELGLTPGYGLPEAGQDIGEQAEKAPNAATGYGRGVNWVANNIQRPLGGALAKADTAVLGKVADWTGSEHVRAMAEERGQDVEENKKAQEEGEYFDKYLAEASPQLRKNIAKDVGKATGSAVGEGLSAFLPTDSALPGAVGQAAVRVAPRQAAKVAELGSRAKTAVADAAMGGVGQTAADITLVQPSSYATRSYLKEGEKITPQEMVRHMRQVQRSHPQALEAATRENMNAAQDSALVKSGLPQKEWDGVLTEVQEKWHSPEAVATMSPAAKAVREELLPYHYALFEYGKAENALPEALAYDPYHKMFGQNPFKRAKYTQTHAGQSDVAAGMVPFEGKPVSQATAQADSAVAKLGPTAGAEMRPNENLPLAKHIDNVKVRLLEQGERTPREVNDALEAMKEATTVDAMGDALGDVMASGGVGKRAAAEVFRTNLATYKQTDPDNFLHVTDVLNGAGGIRDLQRTSLGHEIGDKWVLPKEVDEYMRKNDLVLLRSSADRARPSLITNPERELVLPKEFAEFDGHLVPRRVGMSTAEAVGARDSLTSLDQGSTRIARGMDRALGLLQKKNVVTLGNPGFYRRNEQANFFRAYGDEGVEAFSGENIDMVKQITNAPAHTAGRKVKLGNEHIDIGQLRDEALHDLGVGHGLTAASRAEEGALGSQAATMGVQKMEKMTGKKFPRLASGAEKYERGRDKVVNTLIKYPGGTMGQAGEQMLWGNQLREGYSAEDGMRLLVYLRKRQRGVSRERAGIDTNSLFINYADKAPIEHVASPLVPFVSYYLGMGRGAARIAAKNPRRFTRVWDFTRGVEGVDQQRKGGAFDPRIKPITDQLSLNPMYSDDEGRLTGARIESPTAETANVAGSLSGQDSRGPWAMAGPVATGAMEAWNGHSPVTNRPIMGLTENDAKFADPKEASANMFTLWNTSRKRGRLGEGLRPYAVLGNEMGSGFLPEPYKAALRYGLDLGASPAAYTEEDKRGAAKRAAARMLFGAGTRRISPATEAAAKTGGAAKWLPEPEPIAAPKRNLRGQR